MKMVTVPASEVIGTADQRVTRHGVPWSHYETMLSLRGESAVPRISFLKGTLEIMSPSLSHEIVKSRIGRLVEVYMLYQDVEFEAVGSWTLKAAELERGAEPDECYLIGSDLSGDRPHLAIEVNWTSGGIDKLEIYRGLGVGEVWIWENDAIRIFVLVDEHYQNVEDSRCLPGIDLERLAAHLEADTASAAIKAYRAELEGLNGEPDV